MANIIHNPSELIELDRDTLDEILLEEYKNPALLRELIRITLSRLKDQTTLSNIYRDREDEARSKMEDMRREIRGILNK